MRNNQWGITKNPLLTNNPLWVKECSIGPKGFESQLLRDHFMVVIGVALRDGSKTRSNEHIPILSLRGWAGCFSAPAHASAAASFSFSSSCTESELMRANRGSVMPTSSGTGLLNKGGAILSTMVSSFWNFSWELPDSEGGGAALTSSVLITCWKVNQK